MIIEIHFFRIHPGLRKSQDTLTALKITAIKVQDGKVECEGSLFVPNAARRRSCRHGLVDMAISQHDHDSIAECPGTRPAEIILVPKTKARLLR